MKTYRFVTTKGSVTIPFDIRIREGWNTGTLVSVEKQKDGALLLRKESICDCGKNNRTHETSLMSLKASSPPNSVRHSISSQENCSVKRRWSDAASALL